MLLPEAYSFQDLPFLSTGSLPFFSRHSRGGRTYINVGEESVEEANSLIRCLNQIIPHTRAKMKYITECVHISPNFSFEYIKTEANRTFHRSLAKDHIYFKKENKEMMETMIRLIKAVKKTDDLLFATAWRRNANAMDSRDKESLF
jgi:hypothetical protein